MRLALVAVVLAGCYRPHATASCAVSCEGGCPSGLMCDQVSGLCKDPHQIEACGLGINDAPDQLDAAPDGDQQCVTFGTGFAHVCLTGISAPVALATTTIDTGLTTDCKLMNTVEGTPVCVIAGTSVSVTANAVIRATGPRPLVVVATSTAIAIEGVLDVSSTATLTGAGADPADCVAKAGQPAPSTAQGAGGGAGGSFGDHGGVGGTGYNNGGVGGQYQGAFGLRLSGGCPGGAGGDLNNDGEGGAGGSGGGAVYLIAAGAIVVGTAGKVWANGHGGGAGLAGSFGVAGGGGGGAGGLVVLDGVSITVNGSVSANGGGGGGASGTKGNPGGAGSDPSIAGAAAAGGTSPSDQGNGGAGSILTTGGPGGSPTSVQVGGGGGGGGAGHVRLSTVNSGAGTISPVPN